MANSKPTERCDQTVDMFDPKMPPSALKRTLEERGWTQKDAAEYLGISKDRLNRLINDRVNRKRWVECAIMGLPKRM